MLAAFTALWHAGSHGEDRSSAVVYLLIAFSALAMGIQSAAVRRLNLPGVSTTYVTGTITTLIAGFVGRMRVAPARVSGGSAPSEPPAGIHQAALQAGVVVIYGLAAVISGLLQTRMPWLVGVTPPFAIAAVLLIIALSHRADESTHAARS